MGLGKEIKMGNKMQKRPDGLIYSQFIGAVDDAAVAEFQRHVAPFLEDATPANPLHFIADAAEEGSWAFSARRDFTKMFEDKRLGKVAITNASRFTRVVATFLMKATGRDASVRFFETEASAVEWLKGN